MDAQKKIVLRTRRKIFFGASILASTRTKKSSLNCTRTKRPWLNCARPPRETRETTGDATGDSNGRQGKHTEKPTGDRNFQEKYILELSSQLFFSKYEIVCFVWEAFSLVFRSELDRFKGSSPVRLPSVSRLSPVCLPLSPVGASILVHVRRNLR